MSFRTLLTTMSATATLSLMAAAPAQAVFFHVGSGSIDGSLCVGNDCVSAESFGFDTIRIKENNLRFHFQDTSTAASFPTTDWRLIANDSANGGASYLGIEDATAGNIVFRVAGGASANSLVVDSQSDVGIGTATPALELQITDGDSPGIRLEQNGTSGFTPQTWDLAGNETNFFLRDATNGSTLPFRVQPGASSNSIFIESTDDVGIGTSAPTASLHVRRTDGGADVLIEEASTTVGNSRIGLTVENNGTAQIALINNDTSNPAFQADWRFQNFQDNFRVTKAGTGSAELTLDASGNLTVLGNIVSGGGGTCDPGPCDAVFDPTVYTVPSIEEHAAFMWANKRLPAVDPTLPGQPFNMTLKVTRMLNELEHAHIYIEELNEKLKAQSEEIAELKALIIVE